MSKPIIPLINEDEILNAPAGKMGMIRDDDIDNGKANIRFELGGKNTYYFL